MKGLSADIRTRRPPGGWRAGYSLVELLIALGILGTVTLMIATVFPAAMIINKESVHDTMGTIIAENALAICRTRLTHTQLQTAGVDHQFRDITDLIPLAEQAYPVARNSDPQDWFTSSVDSLVYPSSRYGWLVAARAVLPGWTPQNPLPDPLPNDYQFVILPYRKFSSTDRPGPDLATAGISIAGDGNIASPPPPDEFDVGAPVIVRASFKGTGEIDTAVEMAYIKGNGSLEETTLAGSEALTVNYTLGNKSPVIGCYVVRTGLSP